MDEGDKGRLRRAFSERHGGGEDPADRRREALKERVRRAMMTSLIGPLEILEEELGGAWGHGLPPDRRTADQRDLAAAWRSARDRILDLGNGQIARAAAAIDACDVSMRIFQHEFKRQP